MWVRTESSKPTWRKWHEERHKARQNSPNLSPFSEIAKTAYDLETADVDGQDYDKNYSWDRPLNELDGTGNNGTDIRELDRH